MRYSRGQDNDDTDHDSDCKAQAQPTITAAEMKRGERVITLAVDLGVTFVKHHQPTTRRARRNLHMHALEIARAIVDGKAVHIEAQAAADTRSAARRVMDEALQRTTKQPAPASSFSKMAKRPGAKFSPADATQRRAGFIFVPGLS